MTRTNRIWKHTDEAFAHADRAFKSADQAFAEAEELFSNLPHGTHIKTDEAHHLRFIGHTPAERWRLAKKFFSLGWSVLFTGKSELHFRDRQ